MSAPIPFDAAALIEANEERERDRLIAERLLPCPEGDAALELQRMGVLSAEAPRRTLVAFTLPEGWTVEADALNHRGYHLLDEGGARRVSAWWKAAYPFASEPGRGHTRIAPAGDGLERRWSEVDVRRLRREFTITCWKCRARVAMSAGLNCTTAEGRDRMLRAQEQAEAVFAREHPAACETARP